MEKKNIKYFAVMMACALAFQACDLTETQKSSADAAMVFGSETGLQTYCNSFYGMLPTNTKAYQQDAMADYFAKTELEKYELGALTQDSQGSWDWEDIRSVNYFLDHNHYESVPVKIRNHFNGIARFFRALLYFDKLKTYGEVPWIDHVLNPGDPELTAPRDSRDVIVSHILEDCDYAFENITTENSRASNANFVNKYCAMLLKSRVCLFEASWRKYHAGTDLVLNCEIPAYELFAEAADAAYAVISSGEFSLHTGTPNEKGCGSYRDLFSSDIAPTDEVLLAIASDSKLSVGYSNYYFNVQAVRASLTRPFMNTYLNSNGTVYSEKVAGTDNYKNFIEETSNRDYRLNQTIRAYDYECKNKAGEIVPTTADYSYTLTGYHIIKFCQDDVAYNVYGANGNDIPIMRYAEVLLNYAEAKAELETLSDEEWKMTIGALRRRAGITGGDLDAKPTKVDTYLQDTYFPDITDPVILEIRRERSIELCLEGFRMDDLKRWACASLWQTAPWTGIFVTVNTPLDMNGDGTPDVYFSVNDNTDPDYASITVPLSNDRKIDVFGGCILQFNLEGRVWLDKMYLEPIASSDITMNPNLEQNPGYSF